MLLRRLHPAEHRRSYCIPSCRSRGEFFRFTVSHLLSHPVSYLLLTPGVTLAHPLRLTFCLTSYYSVSPYVSLQFTIFLTLCLMLPHALSHSSSLCLTLCSEQTTSSPFYLHTLLHLPPLLYLPFLFVWVKGQRSDSLKQGDHSDNLESDCG